MGLRCDRKYIWYLHNTYCKDCQTSAIQTWHTNSIKQNTYWQNVIERLQTPNVRAFQIERPSAEKFNVFLNGPWQFIASSWSELRSFSNWTHRYTYLNQLGWFHPITAGQKHRTQWNLMIFTNVPSAWHFDASLLCLCTRVQDKGQIWEACSTHKIWQALCGFTKINTALFTTNPVHIVITSSLKMHWLTTAKAR